MEKDTEAQPENRIKDLTDKLFDLQKQLEPIKKQLAKINEQIGPVERELLETMIMNEMKSFEDAKGRGIITWDAPIRAKVINPKEFFLFLREQGDDAVAKLQVGPDVITEELLEKIKKANPEELKIGMHWQTLLAYNKSKVKEAEATRLENVEDSTQANLEDEERSESDILLDRSLWPDGIEMNQNEPELKIKPPKEKRS